MCILIHPYCNGLATIRSTDCVLLKVTVKLSAVTPPLLSPQVKSVSTSQNKYLEKNPCEMSIAFSILVVIITMHGVICQL